MHIICLSLVADTVYLADFLSRDWDFYNVQYKCTLKHNIDKQHI